MIEQLMSTSLSGDHQGCAAGFIRIHIRGLLGLTENPWSFGRLSGRGILPDNGHLVLPGAILGRPYGTEPTENRERENQDQCARFVSQVSKARPGAPGGWNLVSQQSNKIDVT